MFSYKTSQKILKILASVSTEAHRKQVIKRNEASLRNKSKRTKVACPHCSNYDCRSCLWTYAAKEAGAELPVLSTPCMSVEFAGNCGGLDLYPDSMEERLRTKANVRWRKAHIKWAKNKKAWGTAQAPEGFRMEVNKNQN